MNIVTLAECKDRLSIDFADKDTDITIMANSIEGELYVGTGFRLVGAFDNTNPLHNLAKEAVLFKLYLDYYNAHTEIDDLKLTRLIRSVQLLASLPDNIPTDSSAFCNTTTDVDYIMGTNNE